MRFKQRLKSYFKSKFIKYKFTIWLCTVKCHFTINNYFSMMQINNKLLLFNLEIYILTKNRFEGMIII